MSVLFNTRTIETGLLQLFLLTPLLLSFGAFSLSCDDTRCKTGSCNETGSCICNLPDPSTILDGDRTFLGGKFCDEEQIMCDGTNSFWCEHGATCEEIVHGENYTCKCRPGYTGLHCEHSGAPCGRIFCFHEAECLVEGDTCECPPDWRGSIDCSLPTRTDIASVQNSTVNRLPTEGSNTDGNVIMWLVVVLAVSCSLAAVLGAVRCVKKFFKKEEMPVAKFRQLSQMQMHGFLDDDEEDESVLPDVIRNDNSHL